MFIPLSFCYLLFFLSGAAALIYQVAWVRSLTVIFGGTHLAITTVLAVFMAGLALGGYVIGRFADSVNKPLKLYGYLELGTAVFATVFIALMKLYPPVYVFLVHITGDSPFSLFLIRFVFSTLALIIPTTLMGGTLPLMTKFLSHRPDNIRGRLSFLYALNTFGAVVGTLLAGFYLLKYYSVSSALYTAVSINAFVGLLAVVFHSRISLLVEQKDPFATQNQSEGIVTSASAGFQKEGKFQEDTDEGIPLEISSRFILPMKLVLFGIGISGFCALAYEVLWTRVLSIIVGATVFSFTVVLAAFLTGIAMGSELYGILPKIMRERKKGIGSSIFLFGMVQMAIGISSLAVSSYVIYLPSGIEQLETFFKGISINVFRVRTFASFSLAFLFMVIPAFLMGVAFPLAGKTQAEYKRRVGSAVGEVLAYNTIGAILGAVTSGFLLVYFFGIERSLEIISALNIGLGLLVIASLRNSKALNVAVMGLGVFLVTFLMVNRNYLRIWDTSYFAVYQSTHPENFDTKAKIQNSLNSIDILYYAEGVESIVSSFKVAGGNQIFMTNGRVEASLEVSDVQNQLALGHVPMLLNKNPEDVLVIGTGSGMTLGATSLYPSVRKIILAEIEPKVIGVARSFERYNHYVLDDPRLRIIFNDGRNFLMTSREKYDVITADPIHPWFKGAGYLYTKEYFDIAAQHLKPGGMVCQWLPLYDLTPDNVKSIVITFASSFKYTMMWLTSIDAQLIGSSSPIILDNAELERKMSNPVLKTDLKIMGAGSVTDFLNHFAMGSKGMVEFARDGVLNTDDNLYLEFSAPLSFGKPQSVKWNRFDILKYRDDIYQHVVP